MRLSAAAASPHDSVSAYLTHRLCLSFFAPVCATSLVLSYSATEGGTAGRPPNYTYIQIQSVSACFVLCSTCHTVYKRYIYIYIYYISRLVGTINKIASHLIP
jgi:hypothetical protein